MTKQTEAMKLALEAAYLAGFNASGEGYNGEYPFNDFAQKPEDDAVWLKDRDNTLREALAEKPAQQCRTDGRCQYAIDSGAEGMGHCPKGKCVMPEPVAGCVCRWNDEGDRVVTCERHQGWLEVIAEWADRARDAEKKLKSLNTSTPAQRKPLTTEEIRLIMDGRGEEGDDNYVEPVFDPFGVDDETLFAFARAIEAAHKIGA